MDCPKPGNWPNAFECLKELIRRSTEKKKVIFLDELSWMDTQGSNFMMALEGSGMAGHPPGKTFV